MIIHSPIISGSLTFADGGTLSLPSPTELSGSFSGSAQFSEIGSHIVPDTANTYDLGSAANYFRDLYISTGSLKGIGNGTVAFKLSGKSGGGLKVTDDNDDTVEIQVKEITLKDTSGGGNNIKLKVENGALKSKKVNNSDVEQSEEPASELSGSFTGSIRDAEFDGDATFNNGMGVTGTSTLGVTNVSGLASLDGGIDVDGVFTVADSTGNVATTGTLSAGNTTVGTLDSSGLASLDGGIDVDSAFTVADTSGNVSTTGTLGVTGTSTLGVINASGLISADAGLDVDGAFTVADSSGNVVTSGTLGVTGLSSLGAVSASAMDVAGHILPAAHNTYDLGSTTKFWRDLYLSSGSLYINGIQVLSTDGTDLTFQTDAGESVKILETGNDTITLESVNGDITLTATGTGNIELDAPIQVAAGKNILSSDGNAISFASDVSLGSNNIFAANLSGIVSSSAITYDGDNISVAGNTVVVGNLTVQGTTTSVDSTTVNIGDNQIVLNSDETGTPTQNGGLEIERGTSTNASIIWNETNDYWMSGLLGAEERIVIGAGNTDITTLGTIATGVWQGTAITHDYIGLDAIDGTNIGDNAINSEHYVDASIDLAHLAADSVDGTKIADNSINSEHYVDASIDTEHIGDDQVTYDKIQNVSATNRILGRDSSGAGAIEEITPANLRTMINVEDGATADQTSTEIRAMFSGGDNVTITNGVIAATDTNTQNDAAAIRTLIGSGNNGHVPTIGSAGEFLKHDGTFGTPSYTTNTDTQLSTADVRGKFSEGTGVTISSGEISIGQAVGTSDDVTFGTVSATGDITAYASSDERLKDNIQNIENPIEKVQSLKGVTWDWNDNASDVQHSLPNVGVIAQDVEKVLPQLVRDNDGGYKAVDYGKLVGLLIEAVKDQQSQIDELKSKLG